MRSEGKTLINVRPGQLVNVVRGLFSETWLCTAVVDPEALTPRDQEDVKCMRWRVGMIAYLNSIIGSLSSFWDAENVDPDWPRPRTIGVKLCSISEVRQLLHCCDWRGNKMLEM